MMKIDQANNQTENQTSYKNLDGVFVTGKMKNITPTYCCEVFKVLNKIEQKESDITHMIEILPTLRGDDFLSKEHTISETLDEHTKMINAIEIIELPETGALKDMKTKISDLLSKNKGKFLSVSTKELFYQIEIDIETITESLQEVSGKNIGNFGKHYKNSDDFKVQILKPIDGLIAELTAIQDDEKILNKKKSLIDTLGKLKMEALQIYNMNLNETLRKKAEASGTTLEDLFNQVFPGVKGPRTK